MRKMIFGMVMLIFASCSPTVSTKLAQTLPSLDEKEEVLVIGIGNKPPTSAIEIGTIKIGDTGFSINCDSSNVIEKAKVQARKAGGNILKITEHIPPSIFGSSCDRITATIMRVDNLREIGSLQASEKIIRPPFSKSIKDYFGKTYPTQKGELYLYASFPHINSFNFNPETESVKRNTGFLGVTLGLDYSYEKNRFLNLSASGVMDFLIPIPAAIDISGEYEVMSSTYISLSHNHRIGRFTIGYGLSYAKNTWDFRYYDQFNPPPPTRAPVKKSHGAFGFVFPAYFQVTRNFHLGAIYRPTFFAPSTLDKFRYEHLISIDFAWKIRLKK